jgi:hypothetical protein
LQAVNVTGIGGGSLICDVNPYHRTHVPRRFVAQTPQTRTSHNNLQNLNMYSYAPRPYYSNYVPTGVIGFGARRAFLPDHTPHHTPQGFFKPQSAGSRYPKSAFAKLPNAF